MPESTYCTLKYPSKMTKTVFFCFGYQPTDRPTDKPTHVHATKNKAGYTATLVVYGWTGAVFELLYNSGRGGEAKDCKNIEQRRKGTDRSMDRQRKGQMDGQTDGKSRS